MRNMKRQRGILISQRNNHTSPNAHSSRRNKERRLQRVKCRCLATRSTELKMQSPTDLGAEQGALLTWCWYVSNC